MYDIDWLKAQQDSNATLKYIFFWGHTPRQADVVDQSCFSQWYPSPFEADGHTYKTAEHWMMAQKALLFNDTAAFEKIVACRTPAEAKKLGREVLGFDNDAWNAARFNIVVAGNLHKYRQHPEMGAFLKNTGSRILVEASPVDNIWGIGMAKDHPGVMNVHNWRGLNLLGFALMETRDQL
ncbi:NADAR family protein [Chitinophaga horti]|uniref:NADAR family protein n=1 Tax=Chitinophaga horti TaxID=2920382 RepID=A0ABY6J888_9BACT|nr:NADAR family protein [Chitinophaga horti]UYQ94499.1 NADAR family protein [Chitinophaga horti]